MLCSGMLKKTMRCLGRRINKLSDTNHHLQVAMFLYEDRFLFRSFYSMVIIRSIVFFFTREQKTMERFVGEQKVTKLVTKILSDENFILRKFYSTKILSHENSIPRKFYPTIILSYEKFIRRKFYPTKILSNEYFVLQKFYPTKILSDEYFVTDKVLDIVVVLRRHLKNWLISFFFLFFCSQIFLTFINELRYSFSEICAEVDTKNPINVVAGHCHELQGNQAFIFDEVLFVIHYSGSRKRHTHNNNFETYVSELSSHV